MQSDTVRRILAGGMGIYATLMIFSSPTTADQISPALVGWLLAIAAVLIWPKSRRQS